MGIPDVTPDFRTAGAASSTKGDRGNHQTKESYCPSWKMPSLSTFAVGLRKLGRRHTAAPSAPEWQILEERLQEEMAIRRSPSIIKTVLSAATWAVSMGIAEHRVPRFFWKYIKGTENAWDDRKKPWEFVAALQTMATQTKTRPTGQIAWFYKLPWPHTPTGRWW